MSDASQQTGPDLHVIFGIDGEPAAGPEPVISLERRTQDDDEDAIEAGAEVQASVGLDPGEVEGPQPPAGEPDVRFAEPQAGNDSDAGVHTVDLDHVRDPIAAEVEVEGVPQAPPPPGPGEFSGVTSPSRRGSSPRFLTDVIVDMGLASRGQVDDALETARVSGTTPERVLLEHGAITQDGLARALAERYGLDHLDLGIFSVDMAA
ncbi:MAG: type secretion system protein GspE, partial [Solirubrobacterales bacterium]|nr:type secretion system protein GspE [Solirubrobacterales bacterium]